MPRWLGFRIINVSYIEWWEKQKIIMLSTSTSSGQTQSEHDVLFFLELSPPTQDLESLLLETLSDEKKMSCWAESKHDIFFNDWTKAMSHFDYAQHKLIRNATLLFAPHSLKKNCRRSTPLTITIFFVSLANRQLIISTNLITQRFEHQWLQIRANQGNKGTVRQTIPVHIHSIHSINKIIVQTSSSFARDL